MNRWQCRNLGHAQNMFFVYLQNVEFNKVCFFYPVSSVHVSVHVRSSRDCDQCLFSKLNDFFLDALIQLMSFLAMTVNNLRVDLTSVSAET